MRILGNFIKGVFKQRPDRRGAASMRLCNARDPGLIPGSGRSLEEGMASYSCLENPMDRGAWQAAVHRVTHSRTPLKQLSSSSKGKHISGRRNSQHEGQEAGVLGRLWLFQDSEVSEAGLE